MQLRLELQKSPVADEVSALIAVVRPILEGILYALKADVVAEVGTPADVKLKMLPRLYREGDGDCGICFEYAVHDAVQRGEPSVAGRIADALSKRELCKVPGSEQASILFGAEKTGSRQLIETAADALTAESVLLYGGQGRPVKLKRHLGSVASAMRRPKARDRLPRSIAGLWKADLFLGHSDSDYWVGTTVKINEHQLEGAKGLRVGIVPAREGRSDLPRKDEARNLVICPLPYDGAFMEVFYRAWVLVKTFLDADARVPKEVALPVPADRQVAKLLEERRAFPVLDIIEATRSLAQPHLLDTDAREADVFAQSDEATDTGALVSPIASMTS